MAHVIRFTAIFDATRTLGMAQKLIKSSIGFWFETKYQIQDVFVMPSSYVSISYRNAITHKVNAIPHLNRMTAVDRISISALPFAFVKERRRAETSKPEDIRRRMHSLTMSEWNADKISRRLNYRPHLCLFASHWELQWMNNFVLFVSFAHLTQIIRLFIIIIAWRSSSLEKPQIFVRKKRSCNRFVSHDCDSIDVSMVEKTLCAPLVNDLAAIQIN